VARDAHVDHPARPEFDEEEGEARPEPAVDDREEIVGPGLVGVVVQEGGPGLPACWGPLGGRRAHVPLDRAACPRGCPACGAPRGSARHPSAGAPPPGAGSPRPSPPTRAGAWTRRPWRARRGGSPADASAAASRLHDAERGAPTADQARQEDEAEPVRAGEHGPLDLAAQDHELLAQEGVLGDQRGPRPGQIAGDAPDARSRRGSGPGEEVTVDRAQRRLRASSDRRPDGREHALSPRLPRSRSAAARAHVGHPAA